MPTAQADRTISQSFTRVSISCLTSICFIGLGPAAGAGTHATGAATLVTRPESAVPQPSQAFRAMLTGILEILNEIQEGHPDGLDTPSLAEAADDFLLRYELAGIREDLTDEEIKLAIDDGMWAKTMLETDGDEIDLPAAKRDSVHDSLVLYHRGTGGHG